MKTITRSLYKKQQGAAALMFLLMLPMLLGLMTLSIEGGRYLRLKAQLADAAEVASLAISARQSTDEISNKALAKKYIETLVPGARNITATVIPKECSNNLACGENDNFVEYQVEVSATLDSWFPQWGEGGLDFSEEVQLAGAAVSRKYQGSTIDVVLVTDFSGSMDRNWSAHGKKIERLKEIVADVSDTVTSYSEENTLALVPFNAYTINRLKPSEFCRVVQKNGNAKSTISTMFTEKTCVEDEPNFSDLWFYTIPLTTDATAIKTEIVPMQAFSQTASYEGIIRGAQIAIKGTNPRKLIIILSDGVDEPEANKDFHTNLLKNKKNHRYCKKIREKLNTLSSSDGNTESKIAVIGFDYDVKNNKNLKKCAGEDNVFSAASPDEVYQLIVGLIDEEIGRLYKPSSIKIPADS